MNITQTRPATSTSTSTKRSGVQVNASKNYDVKVSRDKVVVRDRNLIEITQFGIRTIINKDDIEDWKMHGWVTKEDQKKAAENKIQKAMEVNAV